MMSIRAALLILAVAGSLTAQTRSRGRSAPPAPTADPPGSAATPTNPNRPSSILRPGAPIGSGTPASIIRPSSPIGGPIEPSSILTPGLSPGAGAARFPPASRRGFDAFGGSVFVPVYVGLDDDHGRSGANVVAPGSTTRHEVVAEPPAEERGAARIHRARSAAEAERVEAADDYRLIALRGGLIYAVSQFSPGGETLEFETLQGDRYVVGRHEVDDELTCRLNRDRGVEIDLGPR